jgi:hypothetical protein
MDQSFDLAMQGGIQGTREIRIILYPKDDPFLRAGAGGRAFDQGAAPEQGVTPTKRKIWCASAPEDHSTKRKCSGIRLQRILREH